MSQKRAKIFCPKKGKNILSRLGELLNTPKNVTNFGPPAGPPWDTPLGEGIFAGGRKLRKCRVNPVWEEFLKSHPGGVCGTGKEVGKP